MTLAHLDLLGKFVFLRKSGTGSMFEASPQRFWPHKIAEPGLTYIKDGKPGCRRHKSIHIAVRLVEMRKRIQSLMLSRIHIKWYDKLQYNNSIIQCFWLHKSTLAYTSFLMLDCPVEVTRMPSGWDGTKEATLLNRVGRPDRYQHSAWNHGGY